MYVAFVPKGLGSTSKCFTNATFKSNLSSVHITRFSLSIEKGISSVRAIDSSAVQLGDCKISDLRFSDDNQLLVLCKTPGKTHVLLIKLNLLLSVWTALVALPYDKPPNTNPTNDGQYLQYSPVTKANQPPKPIILSNEEVIERFPRHRVATDGPFVPESLEVRQQNPMARKSSKQRVVILERDRLHYNVLQFAEPASEEKRQNDEDVSMS